MADARARLERHLVAAVTSRNPRIPEGGALLWRWFVDLSNARSSGFSPNPIGYAEIDAYARLHRIPIEANHVAILRAMDHAFLGSQTEREMMVDGKPLAPRSSGQKLTAAAFDAVFG